MAMKQKKWEMKMHEQRELRKAGAELLHQRARLLVACYEDNEFRAWCESTGKNDLDVLDEELADVAIGFLTLKTVLEKYPDADIWRVRNIRELVAEVIDSQKSERKTSERIGWKERCLAAEKECERLRGELAALNKALEISGALRAA